MVSYLGKEMNCSLTNSNDEFNNMFMNSYNYNMNFLYPFNLMYPNQMNSKSKNRKNKDNFFYVPPIDKNDKMKLILPESNKNEILEWIKSLNSEERFELFTIEDQCLCSIIIKMYWKMMLNGDKSFAQYQHQDKIEKDINFLNSKIFETFFCCQKYSENDFLDKKDSEENCCEEILKNIRIMDSNQIFDTLSFAPSMVDNVDRLLYLFEMASENNSFSAPCQVVFDENLKDWIWEAPNWFKPNSFQSISSWIVAHFEKSIWINY